MYSRSRKRKFMKTSTKKMKAGTKTQKTPIVVAPYDDQKYVLKPEPTKFHGQIPISIQLLTLWEKKTFGNL